MRKLTTVLKYACAIARYGSLMEDYCDGWTVLTPEWFPGAVWRSCKERYGLPY